MMLELVMQMEKGVHYDVILLDICMPGMNGIQCAKDIRQYDNLVKIIFLTSSTEYAVESYSVKAHNYLLKPTQKKDLFLTQKRCPEILFLQAVLESTTKRLSQKFRM